MNESEFDNLDAQLLLRGGKIIHQIWFNFKKPDEESPVPDKYQEYRNTWITNNPNWTHILWRDRMADWLVHKHYNSMWTTYAQYYYPIQRVDFIRLCMLHRYGGLYADMDTKCNRSVDEMISGLERNIAFGRGKMQAKSANKPSNYLMFSQPGEEFWLVAMEGAKRYGRGSSLAPYHYNIFHSAGPLRIHKTDRAMPGHTQLFNSSDVLAFRPEYAAAHPDVIAGCAVLHEMHNTWISKSEIASLVIRVLFIIYIVIIAAIIAIRYVRSRKYSESHG
jgi:hypothetical protein